MTAVRAGLFACALAALAAGCGDGGGLPVEPITQPGDYSRTMQSNGLLRAYSVHVPASMDPSAPSPLLLVFHGVPRADMRALTGLDDVADALSFIVVYVEAYAAYGDWDVGCGDCTAAGFRGSHDIAFVRDLITKVRGDIAIDPARVYAAGYSQGALFTQRLACEAADRLAGAFSVAATMLASVARSCAPSSSISMLFIHGSDDDEFPPGGREEGAVSTVSIAATLQRWASIGGCAATPMATMLPDTADDGTMVELHEYTGCAPGRRLAYYDVQGGGHTWPGARVDFPAAFGRKSRDLDASLTIGRIVAGS